MLLGEGESFDSLLRRFNRKVQQDGVLLGPYNLIDLQESYNYVSIAPKKGIFEPTFLSLNLDFKQRELARKIKIKITNLNKRQINDLYYWTKYVLNNQLDYLFKS